MVKIIEVKPNLYVVEKKGNYRQVFPVVKDINKPFGKGNINWKNMFRMDWMTIMLLLLIIGSILAYFHDLKGYREMLGDRCIMSCKESCDSYNPYNLNLSNLNLSKEENETTKLSGKPIFNQGV